LVIRKIGFKPFNIKKASVYDEEAWVKKAVFDPELARRFDEIVALTT